MLPSIEPKWLRLFSIPFKAFVIGYGVIYPFWLYSMPGTPGTIGGPDYTIIENLAVGYFISFLILLIVGIIQTLTKNRRDAIWSFVFAILAFFIGAEGTFHPVYQ
jgi:hypothetical protein